MITLNAEIAGHIFDTLVEKGNFENRMERWVAAQKEEFIQQCAEGINEYWYPTNCGSSIKVYFNEFRAQAVWVYAQTINTTKEKNLVEETNAALLEYVTALRSNA
jgi:hypothetical protein